MSCQRDNTAVTGLLTADHTPFAMMRFTAINQHEDVDTHVGMPTREAQETADVTSYTTALDHLAEGSLLKAENGLRKVLVSQTVARAVVRLILLPTFVE